MNRRALITLPALLIAALAPAAPAAAKSKPPVVSSISPLHVSVGEKLTIRGKNFVPGKGKTRVFFVRIGGKGTASAAADSATRSRVTVTVPAALNSVLKNKSGQFKVRVLAKSFGKWSTTRKSPRVYPSAGPSAGSSNPAADCDKDGTPNGSDTDDDNDGLPDTQELQLGTDSCKADTDGDGIEDGFEYQSALDLNRTVLFDAQQPLPYPGKRPYPNPLYPDADVDHDGDGLTQADEQLLWKTYGHHSFPLNYSAGLKTTVATPAPAGNVLQQMDSAPLGPNFHDGWLDDGERDADGDHLTNWDEFHGRMTPEWWIAMFDGKLGPKETPYPVSYTGTDPTDADTDGDGVIDGQDDNDHDGLSNEYEVARPWNWNITYISVASDGQTRIHDGGNPWSRTQPFNPCKPIFSATCHNHPPIGLYGDDEDWEGMYPADAAGVAPQGDVPGPIFGP